MIDPLTHIFKKDKTLERAILCEIIMCKYIHPDIKTEYFTDLERDLFIELNKQWTSKKEIDIELLRYDHEVTIQNALDSAGTSSETAIDKLRELWFERRRGEIMIECEKYETGQAALKNMQKLSGEALMVKNSKEYNHEETMNILITQLEKSAQDNKEIRGIPINLKNVDEAISGIEKSMFYVLGALKKTGKSRFMMHMACELERGGYGILIDSLEMTPLQLNACALAHYSGIDQSNLGRLKNPENQKKFSDALVYMANFNLTYCREYSVNELWQRVDYMKTKRKIDVVFVDFLQRLKDDRYKGDRVREVENTSQLLANMSRELDIAIIALCQLSGIAERLENEEIPDMSYLKESQGIAENADCIMMMHNPKRHESPFVKDAGGMSSYECQQFKMLVEQRYGITGQRFEFKGDLRSCTFWS
jgi:replicative DNA helicase